MTRSWQWLARAALLGIAGCSAGLYSTDFPLNSFTAATADGVFRYRVPKGWFSAYGSDAPDPQTIIWLLRDDYRATITVSRVQLDSAARRILLHSTLDQSAQLLMPLAVSGQSSYLVRTPEVFDLEGRTLCAYEIERPDVKERVRVVLMKAGDDLFESVALLKDERGDEAEVFSAQQTFLSTVEW